MANDGILKLYSCRKGEEKFEEKASLLFGRNL